MTADPQRSSAELAAAVIELAAGLGVRIAAAESLTGGLLAATLVSVPGASRAFTGGIVAYDTALKHSLLGVDRALLDEFGPVHSEVAKQMARGVRRACAAPIHTSEAVETDLGIATTGVAGPDPDPQTGQAAGTVWLGASDGSGDAAFELALAGDRAEIRDAVVRSALELLLARLEAHSANRANLSELDSHSGNTQE